MLKKIQERKLMKNILKFGQLLPVWSWLIYGLIAIIVVGLQVIIDICDLAWTLPLLKNNTIDIYFGIYSIVWVMIIPIVVYVAEALIQGRTEEDIFDPNSGVANTPRQIKDLKVDIKTNSIFCLAILVLLLVFIVPEIQSNNQFYYYDYVVIVAFLFSVLSMFLSFSVVRDIVGFYASRLNSNKKQVGDDTQKKVKEFKKIINE